MSSSTTNAQPGSMALRSSALGGVLVLSVAGVLWLVLPDASRDAIGGMFLAFGVMVGVLSGSVGNALIAFGAMKPVEDPRNSTGFLQAVVLDFALQLVCVAICLFALFLKEVKFQQIAAFGVSFAFAVMVVRMSGTVVVNRALVQRSKLRLAHKEASAATGSDS